MLRVFWVIWTVDDDEEEDDDVDEDEEEDAVDGEDVEKDDEAAAPDCVGEEPVADDVRKADCARNAARKFARNGLLVDMVLRVRVREREGGGT